MRVSSPDSLIVSRLDDTPPFSVRGKDGSLFGSISNPVPRQSGQMTMLPGLRTSPVPRHTSQLVGSNSSTGSFISTTRPPSACTFSSLVASVASVTTTTPFVAVQPLNRPFTLSPRHGTVFCFCTRPSLPHSSQGSVAPYAVATARETAAVSSTILPFLSVLKKPYALKRFTYST